MAPIGSQTAQVLRQAETIRAGLKSTSEDFNVGSAGWSSRQMLQDLYKRILLNDLELALDKKIEQDLWNSAFKSQIDFLREKARDKKCTSKNEVQAVLTLFLETASGFYIQLLQELCMTYDLDLPGHARSSHLGLLDDGDVNSSSKRPHTQSCYYVCQDCLVHLGDIARYCDDATQAEVFYRHALLLVPSNGQPYNQLAILASARGDHLGTVYFYCRSIAVKNQFPAASTNLHKTFNKISSCHNTHSSSLSMGAISKAEFIHLFLQFHSAIYLVQDLSEAKKLQIRLVEEFKVVLRQNLLSSGELVRLLTICLFTLFHIRTGGAEELEEFDCISKDEEESWIMGLELTVEMFIASVCWAIDHLQEDDQPRDNSLLTLPLISVFCQWVAANASSLWREDLVKEERVWSNFASLLNLLPAKLNFNPETCDIPLKEDWELHSFLPLRSAHRKLSFTIHKSKVEDEMAHRINRLIKFGTRLASNFPRVLSKVEDLSTGLAHFSLRTDSSSPDNEVACEIKSPQSPHDLDLDLMGPKLLPSSPLSHQKSSSPTPFAETSSLFNSCSDGVAGGVQEHQPVTGPSPVAQYSLFQSGWRAPLASALHGGVPGAPTLVPIQRPALSVPSPTGRVPHLDQIPHVPNGPSSLPSSPGEPLISRGTVPGLPMSASPGPLGGFGLSGGWGSGVWGPVPSTSVPIVNNNPPPPPTQAIWGSDFSAQGLSPLQQLLQEQQKLNQNGT
ncbi:nonsense-mediated mRNA decay factor SMG7 isoform X2 [Nematostella vectensis]|uniref:nonsense-mediated mRNA decay factor SMG7 isoform X2 n=1 Tax=Nematostella vectensis TaxID=45351 RepID=UPI002077714C|nr:nonsense-mediated mRNA decay factor SMG7 isoform X2 [Nematostella vectensis]